MDFRYFVALKRAVGFGGVFGRFLFLVSSGLLWQKNGLDVWKNSSLSDRDSGQKLVQLLVVADSELKMSWCDTGLLVVTGSVTGQLENFSSEVLKDSGQVDWGSGSDALSVVSFAKNTVKTTDWELKSSS
ncbi:Protein CBG26344 [Caenorhabditis briggsae]|uniref:Protein CBG26344 n=1 Tax=Caenorhabditis briggsae TaxID=6238 RepID=B6IGB5_CAEBR|nr:Protein CBG26344 [Caenorhabditis briggsae]CAR98945.1 Protein CBG26344 [Caenorhabditis briggsae]